MKKVLKFLLLVILIMYTLSGCKTKNDEDKLPYTGGLRDGRFVQIGEYDNGDDFYIVYDQSTFVIYVVSNSEGNKGTFSPLYNSDGSLLTYDPSID